MSKIVLKDRMYVSKDLIPLKAVKQRYKIELFNEKECIKCDNISFRPNDLCENCPAFIAKYKLFQDYNDKYWSLPQGDYDALAKILDKKNVKYKTVDKRPEVPFKAKIKFTGKLFGAGYIDENGIPRPNQEKLVRKWKRTKNGIIQAKPRSGKCLVGDTIINTNDGWIELEELVKETGYTKAKGTVSNHKGTGLISHHYKDKSTTIYVETNNGVTIECTPEHPLKVLTKNLELKWRRADNLKPGDMLITKTSEQTPIWGSRNDVSIAEAKLIGYMVANGRKAEFCSSDKKVVDDFKQCVSKVFGNHCSIRIEKPKGKTPLYHLVGASKYMRQRGWFFDKGSRNKNIPLIVRESSREVVMAFINAYTSCDSHNNGKQLILNTASQKLSKQLQTILYMGFDVRSKRIAIHKSAKNSNNPVIRKYYSLIINSSNIETFFSCFPDTKAKKNFNKIANGSFGQNVHIDVMPPLKQFIFNTYDRYFTGQHYNNQRLYSYRDGSVKTFKSPLGANPIRRDKLSRYKFNQIDWSEQLEDLRKLDKIAYKNLKKYLRVDPSVEIIKKVKVRTKIKDVYDITVPESHAFYANGILSHNTVMSVALTCDLGQRTVIMADRKELLKQFYFTYMGNPKRGRPAMTNIPLLQKKTGKEIIRIANKPSDLKNLKDVDILLLNYQKLVRRPKDMAKLIENKFSVLVVDEVHGSGAEGYLRVVSNCSVKHRLSLTATPRRKDNRHKLINRIMGQVVAKSESASLLPTIIMKHSEHHPPRSYKMWHHALAWISNSPDLQKEIVKQVFKDLRDGHEVIIIPLDRKKQINTLCKMINHQAKMNRLKKGEKWPKELAIKFYDGVDRDTVLDTVDKKGPTVLLAMRSMVKQGIDFSRPSMLYVYIPMSASNDRETGAPMLEQLANRVCTPAKKPKPVVRVWLHNVGMFQSCIRGLGWNEIVPNMQKGKEGKYILDKSFINDLKGIGKTNNLKSKESKTFEWV